MSLDKKPGHMEDDTLHSLRERDIEEWSEIKDLAEKEYENWAKTKDGKSGVIAQSPRDYINRSCIKCSGSLYVFEETSQGNILLKCSSCGKQQWSADIEPYDAEHILEIEKNNANGTSNERHIPDDLYRQIPDSLILEYVQMRKNMKQS